MHLYTADVYILSFNIVNRGFLWLIISRKERLCMIISNLNQCHYAFDCQLSRKCVNKEQYLSLYFYIKQFTIRKVTLITIYNKYNIVMYLQMPFDGLFEK